MSIGARIGILRTTRESLFPFLMPLCESCMNNEARLQQDIWTKSLMVAFWTRMRILELMTAQLEAVLIGGATASKEY